MNYLIKKSRNYCLKQKKRNLGTNTDLTWILSYINNNVSTNNINNYVMNFIRSFKIHMIKHKKNSIFYQKKLLQKMKRILIHTNSKQKAAYVTSTIMGRYGHMGAPTLAVWNPMWCCYNILVCKKGAQNSWFNEKKS